MSRDGRRKEEMVAERSSYILDTKKEVKAGAEFRRPWRPGQEHRCWRLGSWNFNSHDRV